MKEYKCTQCKSTYVLSKYLNKSLILENPNRYFNTCSECRLYKVCPICKTKFKHKQNQSCSKTCASELKKRAYIKSCGTPHNFSKKSTNRKLFEDNLFNEFGVKNVWQRPDVKQKIENTFNLRYGVSNISKVSEIKERKNKTFRQTLKNNPNLLKDKWWKRHDEFILKQGYDPRLGIFGKASHESLKVFKPIITWCKSNNIEDSDIYIGLNEKSEYFISTKQKVYFYDFCIRSKKLIIEFHGIGFHVNPNWSINKQQKWRSVFTNETAKVNLKKTQIKNNKAISSGFKILEIWSDIPILENINNSIKFIKSNI